METRTIDNSFFTFGRTPSQKNGLSSKKKNRGIFEQVIPSNIANPEPRNQAYLLGDLSAILSNQSLTQEQIAKSQKKIIDEKFEVLSRKYKISKTDEVKNFLSNNRFLIKLIEEISSKISQYFGVNQKPALKISYEPEFPSSSELLVEIRTELSAKEAMPLLEKFDEEWWLENLDKANYKLSITLKFV